MTKVVTRIPPSPTGRLHIGTARTALFNFLFAKHEGGTVVYRSEDTDRARSTREFETEITEGLGWLGIEWDSFSRQSEHPGRYRELLEQLIREGKAYLSSEPSKDDPTITVELVRLKNPGKVVTFRDEVRGDISFDTTELKDFVIARSLDDALYHFAVVVDDMDSEVTHIIRGEDHISNTPRQILIQEALGASRPSYAHLPLILDEKRAKLSKRTGATSVSLYRDEGILPEALVNYLALLGWNPGTEEEYFNMEELIQLFSLEGVQKGGAVWDRIKLLSVNQHWMRELPNPEYVAHFAKQAAVASTVDTQLLLPKILPLLKERAHTFGEVKELLRGELSCLFTKPEINREMLVAKEPADRPGLTKSSLESLLEPLQGLTEGVSVEVVKNTLMPLADAEEAKGKKEGYSGGRGAVLWPLRYALSGQERSPDPFTLISIMGPHEALSRVQKAIDIL